jgi:hypothetical protein
MNEVHTRRSFFVESAALLVGASFVGCRSSTDESSLFDNRPPRIPRKWPDIPVREATLEFPKFVSFEKFSRYSVGELAQLALQDRPADMWMSDLHAVAARDTMKTCFGHPLTVVEVDAVKREIDRLAKIISGEIVFRNTSNGREISLREKVEIINAVFFGPKLGRFGFISNFGDNPENRVPGRGHTNRLFDEVWSSRRGVCEDLVAAYICIIDRLNQAGHQLDLSGVTTPGHILIRASEGDDLFYVELTDEGRIYEHTEILEQFKITGKPHLVPGPLTSVACSISNAAWLYNVRSGDDWGKIVDPAKAKEWTDLMAVAIMCSPEDTFYRVKLAAELIEHGHHLDDPDMEGRLLKILTPIAKNYPLSREPEVLLARFYESELGGKQKEKAIKLLTSALKKPQPNEGDERSVTMFVTITTGSIEYLLDKLRREK